MFQTIGHTFELMGMSWRVLRQDRQLILFPVLAGTSILVLLGLFAVIAAATGALDRMDAVSNDVPGAAFTAGDYALGIVLLFLATFTGIFFNSALIAAALERLRGGNPTVESGLKHALTKIDSIIGWAVISTTVGILLQILSSNDRIGRVVSWLIGGAWAYMTFFVVPLIVAEGVGPFESIGKSTSLLRQTWGRQVTSAFAFWLVYLAAMIVVIVPAALCWAISPLLGIIVGVLAASLALATVAAMEGIFKAALYQYAKGETPASFDSRVLSSAFHVK
jgi:hypothetical protein